MSLGWLLIRGSGLVAFGLLAAATIWGLLLSTKVLGRAVKARPVSWFHESLAIGSLIATGIHMVALTRDEFITFGTRQLLVPGAATYRPMAVALGITAFYTVAIVSVSFYVKRWIGQAAWRAIHYASFGAFLAALLHGIVTGTDSTATAVTGLYIAALAAVTLLLVVRWAQTRVPASTARRGTARRGPGPDREPAPTVPRASSRAASRPGSTAVEPSTGRAAPPAISATVPSPVRGDAEEPLPCFGTTRLGDPAAPGA